MEIGIIGSGQIGRTLARHLAALGHQVSIANSRGPASLVSLAAQVGATAATAEKAARAKDIVVIAVPEKSVRLLPRDILANTSAVIIDAGNYYRSRDMLITQIDCGLPECTWLERLLRRPVVKVFNNIRSSRLPTWAVPAYRPVPTTRSLCPSPG